MSSDSKCKDPGKEENLTNSNLNELIKQDSIFVDPYKMSLSGQVNNMVTVEYSYIDFLRVLKLIERDEAARQRARAKTRETGKSIRDRNHKLPIQYKVIKNVPTVKAVNDL